MAGSEWVDWLNSRLVESVGTIRPAAAEANFRTDLQAETMAA